MWYQFQTDFVPEVIQVIPGLRVSGRTISVPDNAVGLVKKILEAHGSEFSSTRRSPLPVVDIALAKQRIKPKTFAEMLDYQKEAVSFGIDTGSASLWHSTGSGKTWCGTVWAAAHPGKFVVVTKSGVRRQWYGEIQNLTNLRPQILEGEVDLEPIDKTADCWIVGYDTLPTHAPRLKGLYSTAVFDEIHKCKSHKRWDARLEGETGKVRFSLKDNIAAHAAQLSRGAKAVLALTATAVSNRPRDLWAQLDLVSPGHWGSFYEFAERYCALHTNVWGGKDASGESNVSELRERIDAVVHRVSFERANKNLPPKRRLVTRIPVSEQVRAVGIKEDLKSAGKMIGSSRTRALLELKLMEAASRKRGVALEMLKDAVENRQKVLVLTGRRRDCEELGEKVKMLGCPTWWGHGGTPEAQREAIKTAYMAQHGPCILVGTIDAWGESYNLQDTDLLLCVMLPYTPRQIIQLEGRVVRLGQKRPVIIHYLVAELTADERVTSILLGKLPSVEKFVGNGETNMLPEVLRGGTDEELVEQLALGILATD